MNQHLVSQVLLNRWADATSKKIGVLDLASRKPDSAISRRLGSLEDLVVVGAEETEGRWMKIERQLPHAFKLIERRQIIGQARWVGVVKDCIVMHFARSFALAEMFNAVRPLFRDEMASNVLSRTSPGAVVHAITGVHVPDNSTWVTAAELIGREFDRRVDASGFVAQVLETQFERGRKLAAGFELEFWYAAEHEFLLGDLPAAAFQRSSDRVGPLNGVRWGDADGIFMPLGPKHSVALSKVAAYHDADAKTVEWMNVRQALGAYREVYYRLESGLGQVLIDALGGPSS